MKRASHGEGVDSLVKSKTQCGGVARVSCSIAADSQLHHIHSSVGWSKPSGLRFYAFESLHVIFSDHAAARHGPMADGPGGTGASAKSELTSLRNARFRGGASTKSGGPNKSPTSSTSGQLSPTNLSHQGSQSSLSLNLPTKLPPLPNSPSLGLSFGTDDLGNMAPSSNDILQGYHLPQPLPIWLNPAYAKHIVKGNFMTLSARPKTVDSGEWIAHQGRVQFPSQANHWLIESSCRALP